MAPWTQTATYINILLGLNNDFKTTLDNQNLHQLQAKAQAKLWTGCRKQDSIVSIHPKQQGMVNTGHAMLVPNNILSNIITIKYNLVMTMKKIFTYTYLHLYIFLNRIDLRLKWSPCFSKVVACVQWSMQQLTTILIMQIHCTHAIHCLNSQPINVNEVQNYFSRCYTCSTVMPKRK